ncbi:MAG: hypothetical protein DRN04_09035 [Thermoprotei archaeon]|nr:MAG: hypothetical protein DRN04_09035 [Thermoprotei archaeon]
MKRGISSLLALLLIIVLLLVGAYIIYKIFFAIKGEGSLLVSRVYWLIGKKSVDEVNSDTVVTAVVVLYSPTGYSGWIEVKVKKDIILFPDETVAAVKQYYAIGKGAEVEVRLTFRAEYSLLTRGYHIEVVWSGGKYTMESNYPPRLKVKH